MEEETGVASGEIRHESLKNLDEAAELTQEIDEKMEYAPEPLVPWFEYDALSYLTQCRRRRLCVW